MKVIHLKTGWNDLMFERKVERCITKMGIKGLYYYDIKISSKDNNCLLIFKKEARKA